jgi:hypothetical protein
MDRKKLHCFSFGNHRLLVHIIKPQFVCLYTGKVRTKLVERIIILINRAVIHSDQVRISIHLCGTQYFSAGNESRGG